MTHSADLPPWLQPDGDRRAAPQPGGDEDDGLDEYLLQRQAEIEAKADRLRRRGLVSDAVRAELVRRGALSVGGRATPRIAPSWTASLSPSQAREQLRARSWEPKG